MEIKERFGSSKSCLVTLGVTEEALIDVVLRGETLRDSATAFDPPTRGGFDAWAERVRALRELFVPQKWTHDTPMGLPRIMSPDGEVAIIVATGDAATGSAAMEPRTKRSIGPIVMHSVEANQLGLFGDSTRVSDGPITWVLLTHRVKGKEVVQAELSLPSTVDVENYVVGWETRWIFGSIPLDSPPKRDYEEPMKSIVNVKAR